MHKIALGLAALTFASTAALAQTPITFAQLDVDADGRLTLAELQSVWPDITQEEFAAVDIDGVGSITPAQLDTLQASDLGVTTTGGATLEAGSGEPDFTLGDPNDPGEIDNADDADIAPDRSLLDSSDDN
jgi:hypothetical protein